MLKKKVSVLREMKKKEFPVNGFNMSEKTSVIHRKNFQRKDVKKSFIR